ncbi:Pentatricopeptide repeat-containing-like protein [Gossypium australe]|uniref:Pentatricopeptide repeat-containing-like protein n=1 Tax=Gossypium australe TaxID=47621 RepID=A0A5B6UGK4_9ROSI|nr:Pentatricopeptide repeat-containing-like protein [Gossypium australe]
MSYRQRGNNCQLSYYRQRITHPKSKPLPAWEKKFYIEGGAMSWERFVEANKNLCENDKVFE